MTEEALFDVYFTGKVKTGHSFKAAIAAFAKLAKIETTKAAQLVQHSRAIKKSISRDRAKLLQQQMEKLGLITTITPEGESISSFTTEATTPTSSGLTLEPMQPTAISAESEATVSEGPPEEPAVSPIEPQLPGECATASNRINEASTLEDDDPTSPSTVKIFIAAGAAAFIGALLWKFIAITFELELGLLAWAIGGMIGAAAVYYGAEGDSAAYLCGALALIAILGGKYWVASSFAETYLAEINSATTQADFDEFISVARDQIVPLEGALSSDYALRKYIVDKNYVVGVGPKDIPAETVAEFRAELEEDLNEARDVGSIKNVEELAERYGHVATSEFFKASFSWLDFLFLALGVYAAFNMARSGSSPLGRKAF
ncbi:hypothetical protein QWI17_08195 [Gilvimarinus sp. SDUM040013]|uniref:Uncharacterized protein n=1 Tax=Gilvimarinus gilvus TaxID=3058038 RepID=A0ABU4S407_9GAMM|nr:hypothetical protein [Gilvimarinus sp. SDUM040013]MDO3385815.1 hypothetical protein [Gilvimarinus sp. SDUM040013]MDX6850623.1 hypothetical protein [Gilvimarinus sp. SDUM040013]